MASRARQWVDYGILRGLYAVARPLPRSWLLAAGRGLGSLVWYVFGYRREVVLDNIRQTLGLACAEDEVRRIARSFYRNLGMTLMEFLAFPRLGADDFRRLVALEGGEHLQEAVELGKGAILVSGHFGNWELFGARVAAEGCPVNFIVKPQSNARVDKVQNRIRHRAGVGTIRTGANIKEMLHALRRGELVGILGDQDAGRDGLFMDFLGREASIFRSPAYLAWKLDCPLLTGHIIRVPNGTHNAVMDPPFYPDPAWEEAEAVRRITEYHTQRLAAAVRRFPEQYFWIHRRWKTRPPEDRS